MTDDLSLTIRLVLIGFILLVLLTSIVNIVKRNKFKNQYGISKLPTSIKIASCKNQADNYYVLNYPYWTSSKKDGTADLRVKNNQIIWQCSILYIDNLRLTSKKPYDLLFVIKELRLNGVKISLCEEEEKKYNKLIKQRTALIDKNGILGIIDYFSCTPTDFEKLCAEVFNKMGYNAKVTPPTNDGGYDIILSKEHRKAIVECKCYAIENKVGRPAVQKLVGANSTVLADDLIFITTSDFSSSAISYAKEVGVELINGMQLIELLNKYNFFERANSEVDISECQLEISDLRQYIPTDIYESYFSYL